MNEHSQPYSFSNMEARPELLFRKLVAKPQVRKSGDEAIRQNIIVEDAMPYKPTEEVRPPMAQLSYERFDVRVSRGEGNQVRTEVLRAPDSDDTESVLQTQEILTSDTVSPESGPATARNLRPSENDADILGATSSISKATFAKTLGQILLPGRCYYRFLRSWERVQQENRGLRIRLRTEQTELAELPWELACIDDSCLSLERYKPLVRYVETGGKSPGSVTVPGVIRLVGIVSKPKNAAALNTTKERKQLKQALQGLIKEGRVELEWLDHASLTSLHNCLIRWGPHVVHYIGHGSYDASNKGGRLAFESPKGVATNATANSFAMVLKDSTVRFVFLNACESGRAAGGLAEVLALRGVPAALGMQTRVLDDVAISFANGFYTAISNYFPVDRALVEGRLQVFAEKSAGDDNPYVHPHWAEPILYMRAPDGQIFDEM